MSRHANGMIVGAVALALGLMLPMDAAAQRGGPPTGRGGGAGGGAPVDPDERPGGPLEGLECEYQGPVRICTPAPRRGEDRDERERDDERGSRDGGILLPGGERANGGGGPPFCRNGQGHPVFGMRWCREKGFGGGSIRWERRGWEDIILRAPRRTGVDDGTLDAGTVIDVLGDIILGRFSAHGRRLGADGPITGRWLDAAGELLLYADGLPIARLRDPDGDGRVDGVWLNAGH